MPVGPLKKAAARAGIDQQLGICQSHAFGRVGCRVDEPLVVCRSANARILRLMQTRGIKYDRWRQMIVEVDFTDHVGSWNKKPQSARLCQRFLYHGIFLPVRM